MCLPDWSEFGAREHFVQLYTSDEHLERCVASWYHAGLRQGDSVVLVGSTGQRARIEAHLRKGDWDLGRLAAEGRYLPFDAAETLRGLLVDDWPHPDLFSQSFGDQLMRAQRGGRKVRAFGQLVTHLWEKGHRAAALRLEELWNELGEILSFSLYCAYPERLFSDSESLDRVCSVHSRVLRSGRA